MARAEDDPRPARRYGRAVSVAAERLVGRLRAPRGRQADAVLAAAVVLEGWVEVLLLAERDGAVPAGMATLLVVGLAVYVRRRRPVLAVAIAPLALIVYEHIDPAFSELGVGPFFAMGLLTWSLGRHAGGRAAVAGLAFALVEVPIAILTDPGATGSPVSSAAFGMIAVVALPFLAGRSARHRARLNEALRAKRDALERDREQQAQRAVLEERTRIAGELHDVVAHALSAMTVQASAARRLTSLDRTDAARDAFAAVEGTGREALGELRRLLGVLRREDEELALAPQPSLVNLESLARRTTASGLPVDLRVRGERDRPVPVGVDLTAYRLVQAALAAARDEGAAGHARVSLSYVPGAVVVVVADDGRAAPRALLGMRERVAVYGGQLDAEPGTAGHVIRARFPLEAAAA